MKKTKFICFCLALIISTACFSGCASFGYKKYEKYYFDYFDTVSTIIGYEKSEEEFNKNCEIIRESLEKYNRLFSIYDEYEGLKNLYYINNHTSEFIEPQEIPPEITELIEYGKKAYSLTKGKVNVAMGSVLSLWHEKRIEYENTGKTTLPDEALIKSSFEHCDISKVITAKEKSTLVIKDENIKLDFGAVAKGFAVEKTAEKLESIGVSGYLLNIGGNIKTVGTKSWNIGIETPIPEIIPDSYTATLALEKGSLVTSGNNQRFFAVDGKKYCHIINPDTLYPAEYFAAVSVIGEDSALSDVLSTGLFCMPFEEGNALIKNIGGIEAMWVYPDGTIKYSNGFEAYLAK